MSISEPTRLSSGRRILVADDLADAAHSMAMLLEVMGHETCVVNDGYEAVSATLTFKPDMILLDLGMPRLNGYDACKRIRDQAGGDLILIGALTGWTQAEQRERAHTSGFDFFLIKPIELGALEKMLRDFPAKIV
jgi:CheY-like chemotaxis protein